MSDPRMSLTLKDATLIARDPARERELARRRARDADADYLGERRAAPEPKPQTDEEWAEEVAAGVVAGLRAKHGARV